MNRTFEGQYRSLLRDLLDRGEERKDRTGTGTLGLFGRQIKFSIADRFPILFGRKLYLKTAAGELLWYMRGDTNIKFLNDQGIRIWDAWADENGELGPVYGRQWRNAPEIDEAGQPTGQSHDQLQTLIDNLRTFPTDRRLIIDSWNASMLSHMRLPPCVYSVQFYVRDNRFLDVMATSRSADAYLGLPHNVMVYTLLTHLLAKHTGYIPGMYTHNLGDVHLYLNHLDQTEQYLARPMPHNTARLRISPFGKLEDLTIEDFTLLNYTPMPAIPAPVSV